MYQLVKLKTQSSCQLVHIGYFCQGGFLLKESIAIKVMSNYTPYHQLVLFEAEYIICGLAKMLEGLEEEICPDWLSFLAAIVEWWIVGVTYDIH